MYVVWRNNQDCDLSFLEDLRDEILAEWQEKLTKELEGSEDKDELEEYDDFANLEREIDEVAAKYQWCEPAAEEG